MSAHQEEMKDDMLCEEDDIPIREWLTQQKHTKQLALLDKFCLELRRGPPSESVSSTSFGLVDHRLLLTIRTVELLRNLIGGTKWKTPAVLLDLLRGVGREVKNNTREEDPVVGNVVRRIMAAVREEATREAMELEKKEAQGSADARLSLQNMLWALPQQQQQSHRPHLMFSASSSSLGSPPPSLPASSSSPTIGSKKSPQNQQQPKAIQRRYPSSFYESIGGSGSDNLKQTVMEVIQEILNDLEDVQRNIDELSSSYIQNGDVVFLCGGSSNTMIRFVKAAATKFQQRFRVVIAQGGPASSNVSLAETLSKIPNILETTVIHDSAIFAVMSRVNKVLVSAHAVLANGGLVSQACSHLVATCAKHYAIPVVCVTGMYKLCPIFPHDGQDTLNYLQNPMPVLQPQEQRSCHHTSAPLPWWKDSYAYSQVEILNPKHDYIPPEYISLYVTNVGSYQPSFIYRLLAEYYHVDDWKAF
jgi:translation initiation factor eIF-2B subunit beta